MLLPSAIESHFTETYEGMRAARFQSSSEAHNMETNLKWLGLSYKTKIIKHKRKGNSYLVMLVEVHSGT
jgi:hypothetical protein